MTYAWLGQAMIMTVAVWNGGATDDLAARIKTGDVAIDLYVPSVCSAGTAALILGLAAAASWRTGLRHYRSTGS